MLLRNSNPGIADLNLYELVFAPGLDGDRPSIRNRLSGIHQNVHENLIDLIRMTLNQGKIPELFFDPDPGLQLVLKERDRALDTFMNVDIFSFRLIEARKVFEALDDLHNPLGSDL